MDEASSGMLTLVADLDDADGSAASDAEGDESA
jgi:hypothetical protein